MQPHNLGAERRIGPADHHGLAARAEVIRDRLHAAPLADLAGDADEIGFGLVIDCRDILVAQPDLKIVRRQRRDRCDCEVCSRDRGRQAARREHLRAEIARHVGDRIDQIKRNPQEARPATRVWASL